MSDNPLTQMGQIGRQLALQHRRPLKPLPLPPAMRLHQAMARKAKAYPGIIHPPGVTGYTGKLPLPPQQPAAWQRPSYLPASLTRIPTPARGHPYGPHPGGPNGIPSGAMYKL
jgi:hypothetical protein